jgi:hypothetical protein
MNTTSENSMMQKVVSLSMGISLAKMHTGILGKTYHSLLPSSAAISNYLLKHIMAE